VFSLDAALCCSVLPCVWCTVWELYTGEDAFQRLQHPGQFFETVVLNDLRPVIPQGVWCLPACLMVGGEAPCLANADCSGCSHSCLPATAALASAQTPGPTHNQQTVCFFTVVSTSSL
jgi:hypothetical protein